MRAVLPDAGFHNKVKSPLVFTREGFFIDMAKGVNIFVRGKDRTCLEFFLQSSRLISIEDILKS